jgi:HEAT repeat protein
VGEGVARFSFPVHDDVEICDQGIRRGEDLMMMWHSRHGQEVATNCRRGPAEVELTLREGSVRDVDLVVGWDDRTPGAMDLGQVAAPQAVDYLLGLARTSAFHDVAEGAVFPAMLADVPEVWRQLLALAKDRSVLEEARTSALFWLGQEAAATVNQDLAGVATAEDEDQEVREAAVFALSQRPSDEGVPYLMDVARTARQKETRQSAMFWLAQSGDDRVLAFFEEILVGGGGR